MKNIGDYIDTYRILWSHYSSMLYECYIVERVSDPGTSYVLQKWKTVHFASSQGHLHFLSQMGRLKALRQPLILSVEDFGVDTDDHPYVLLPYEMAQMKRLSERLQRGALSEDEAENILTDVSAALVLAHQHDLIHGFFSPESVLLTPRNEVRVTAFLCSDPDLSDARSALPIQYRFPESSASRLSDQYALAGLVQNLLLEQDEPPEDAASIRQTIARAQALEPTQRFESIRDFLGEVGYLLDVPENEKELEPSLQAGNDAQANSTRTDKGAIWLRGFTGSHAAQWSSATTRVRDTWQAASTFLQSRFFQACTRRRAGIAALCLVLLLILLILHIVLPASAATVTITPMSHELNQAYVLTVSTRTDLASHQIHGRMLTYKTSTRTKTVPVRHTGFIAGSSSHGEIVFSQLTGEIDLSKMDIIILPDGLWLSFEDHTSVLKPGATYTEAAFLSYGSASNVPAYYFNSIWAFQPTATETTDPSAYLYNPQPFTGGKDDYNGPIVASTDVDPVTMDFATQAKQEAQHFFQSHLLPGEALLNNLNCSQINNTQPSVGSPGTTVTVTFYSTCQIEAYDQQETNAALFAGARQLALHSFDSHFALVHPLKITVNDPGTPGPDDTVVLDVQSEWRLLLDTRGRRAVQQALAGLSQGDARALLLSRYDSRTNNLSLSWWWGEHMPIDPSAIQIIARYSST
jgi:serine/threonine protein kinase